MPEEDLIAERKRKLEEFERQGNRPYNRDFFPTYSLDAARRALEDFENAHEDEEKYDYEKAPVAKVAGRIMRLRRQGKSCFAHIEEHNERMQVWMRLDVLG